MGMLPRIDDRWLSRDLEVLARAVHAGGEVLRMWLENVLFVVALLGPPPRAQKRLPR